MLRLSLGTGYNSMIAAFKDWIKLRIDLGQPLPIIITGDSCCKTRAMLCKLFPHLARRLSCHDRCGSVGVNEVTTFEDLTYPCTPIIVDSLDALERERIRVRREDTKALASGETRPERRMRSTGGAVASQWERESASRRLERKAWGPSATEESKATVTA